MASTDSTPADGAGENQTPVNPALATPKPAPKNPPKKRLKTVRTTIRHLLPKAVNEAIARLVSTEDSANKHVVGTSALDIETHLSGAHAGQVGKKHVKVEVTMSVTDDPHCVCPVPPLPTPLPPVPTPVKRDSRYYWWMVWPILAGGLFLSPVPQSTQTKQPPPVVVTAPVNPTPGGPVVTEPTKPVPAPTPPVPAPLPAAPGVPPVSTGGAGGTIPTPGHPIDTPPPYVGGACDGLTGQLATAPDYTEAHTPASVKSHADSWFVKRQPRCGATVVAFDLCSRVINVQDYGANMNFLGQRVYAYKGDLVQIDSFNPQNQFVGRTMYTYAGGYTRRISLAFRFDAQQHKQYEARIVRDLGGSITSITLWTFGPQEQVLTQQTIVNPEQIALNLSRYFYQFPDFESGSW